MEYNGVDCNHILGFHHLAVRIAQILEYLILEIGVMIDAVENWLIFLEYNASTMLHDIGVDV